MPLLIRYFPYYARMFTGVALFFITMAFFSGCSSDNAKESESSSDAALLKVMGVKDRKIAKDSKESEKGESLNMQIAQPDFDRNRAEPEIKLDKRKENALDF